MSAIRKTAELVSPEDYLRGEALAKRKHEYLGGIIHAMAGARNIHNKISKNILVALDVCLRGKPCEPYNSDTKVRIRMPSGQIRFYYPDVQIICDPNSPDDSFQDRPVLIVEVTSPSTWRMDHVEKFEAYTTIPTLEWYLLVETRHSEVTVYRRTAAGFHPATLTELTDSINLESLGVVLPLAEIYNEVIFPPPSDDPDEDE